MRQPQRQTDRRRERFGILETHFFAIDLIVGFSLPAYVHLRHRSRPDAARVIGLFWLGVAVGLTWEVPLFLSAISAENPIVGFLREPPLHPAVFMIAHAFWDGGLFLVGLALVRALCAHPVLASFRWSELAVFTAWGQASALAVEVVSVLNRGWFYPAGHAWNPLLFHVDGHPITALPQLIWLAAPLVYYVFALRLIRRADSLSDAPSGARPRTGGPSGASRPAPR